MSAFKQNFDRIHLFGSTNTNCSTTTHKERSSNQVISVLTACFSPRMTWWSWYFTILCRFQTPCAGHSRAERPQNISKPRPCLIVGSVFYSLCVPQSWCDVPVLSHLSKQHFVACQHAFWLFFWFAFSSGVLLCHLPVNHLDIERQMVRPDPNPNP